VKRVALLAALPLALAMAGDLELTPGNWRSFREKIVPAKNELAWQTIAWKTSFYAALEQAQSSEQPVLLWAMDGHPLGCT